MGRSRLSNSARRGEPVQPAARTRQGLIRTALSEDGALLLSVRLFDESGTLLAEIDENEWISHEPLFWDIEHAPQRLSVRRAERKVALNVDWRVEPVVIRGELWYGGQRLKASKNALICDGATIKGGGTFVTAQFAFRRVRAAYQSSRCRLGRRRRRLSRSWRRPARGAPGAKARRSHARSVEPGSLRSCL
jgi:hypothetical protein